MRDSLKKISLLREYLTLRKLFPTKTIHIVSTKTLNEIYQIIDESNCAGYSEDGVWKTPVIGDRNGNSFTLSKVLNYRNSFFPTAYGEIVGNNGEEIEIYLYFKLNEFIRKFLIFFIMVFCVTGFLSFSSNPVNLLILTPIPLVLYFFSAAYKNEFKDSIKLVCEHLK